MLGPHTGGSPRKKWDGKVPPPSCSVNYKTSSFSTLLEPGLSGHSAPRGDSQQRGTASGAGAELRGTQRQTPHRVVGRTRAEHRDLAAGSGVRSCCCTPCWSPQSETQSGGFAKLKTDRALFEGLRICKSKNVLECSEEKGAAEGSYSEDSTPPGAWWSGHRMWLPKSFGG